MILARARNAAQALIARSSPKISWCKQGGWLGGNLPATLPRAPRKLRVEDRAWQTNQGGKYALDARYGEAGGVRAPEEVRSAPWAGDLYAWLVAARKPEVVIEFGSAFGVSGMYWLAGLDSIGQGRLYSFEMNSEWAAIARGNMAAISGRFTLTVGAFEDCVGEALKGKLIDIAFVDGIHTGEFIKGQWEILRQRLAPRAIVLFDDIDFPKGGMAQGWEEIWRGPGIVAACEVGGHTGVVEWAGRE